MTDPAALLDLCHRVGDPALDLVIAAEGNVSARTGDGTFAIKASGCSLRTMGADRLVEVRMDTVLALLDVPDATDEQTAAAYRQARTDHRAPMPSVEAILHAVLYADTAAQVVVHTHPTAVNALLCSVSAPLLVQGALFPDQVVVLGPHQLLVPYVDPGVRLARAVRQALAVFTHDHGAPPRVVYLANHGMFALASTPDEALTVTLMAVKAARILAGAIAAGGPVPLPEAQVERIETRPDEHYRRAMLADGKETR